MGVQERRTCKGALEVESVVLAVVVIWTPHKAVPVTAAGLRAYEGGEPDMLCGASALPEVGVGTCAVIANETPGVHGNIFGFVGGDVAREDGSQRNVCGGVVDNWVEVCCGRRLPEIDSGGIDDWVIGGS